MCHQDGLKVAKCELPFINPLSKMWINAVKVIDQLHIRNHKDAKPATILMRKYLHSITPWHRSKLMCGPVGLRESSVLRLVFINFFTYTML